jgi:hypothetical protein
MEGQGDTRETNVIPLKTAPEVPAPTASDKTEWGRARTVLYQQNPMLYSNWIESLERKENKEGRLTLTAPSKFHAHYVETHLSERFLTAVRAFDEDVRSVIICT